MTRVLMTRVLMTRVLMASGPGGTSRPGGGVARRTAGRGRGRPLRRAQGRVEQAERVPGQPGQGVPHAAELAGAASAARVPVPARSAADRAPLALRGLVGQLLGGRGLPDVGVLGGAAAASER